MNHNKSKGFRSFVKEKGYYIVLLLCAAAVGVSGYFLISRNGRSDPPEAGELQRPSHQLEASVSPSSRDVLATEPPREVRPPVEQLRIVLPVPGEATAGYSADALRYNPTTKDWRTHEGVDLKALPGQKVMAAMDGTVHHIYEDSSLGMTVVLRHGDGFTTQYSNLSENITLKVGQEVPAGAVLGTVGDTALVEKNQEPHLHFAVYRNHVPCDPMTFLKGAES